MPLLPGMSPSNPLIEAPDETAVSNNRSRSAGVHARPGVPLPGFALGDSSEGFASVRDGDVGVPGVADENGLVEGVDLVDGLLVGVVGALVPTRYGFCSGVVSRCVRIAGMVPAS